MGSKAMTIEKPALQAIKSQQSTIQGSEPQPVITPDLPPKPGEMLDPVQPAPAARSAPTFSPHSRLPGSMPGGLAFDRILHLTRASGLPALLMPVLVGSGLAYWSQGQFNLPLLGLSLVGAGALYLALNGLMAYYDHQRYLSTGSSVAEFPVGAQPGAAALHNWGDILSTSWLMILIGAAAGLWVAYLSNWPVLYFSGLSLLLALAYVLPPVQIGYRLRGLGEVALFVAMGWLPVMTSFYAQTQSLPWLAIWGGLPVALLVGTIFYNQHFHNWHRDWRLRKQTPVVALHPRRAADVSGLLTLLAYSSYVLLFGLGFLPSTALLALIPLPLALGPFARLPGAPIPQQIGIQIARSGLLAATISGLLMALALGLSTGK